MIDWNSAAVAAGAVLAVVLLLMVLGWVARSTRAFPGARTAPRSGGGCLVLLVFVVGLLVATAAVVR